MRASLSTIWTAITAIIGPDEAGLLVACGLIAFGCWDVWRPGAYLVPGIVLLYLVLPTRAAFIAPPPAPRDKP